MVIGQNPNKGLKINLGKIYQYVDEIHLNILEKSFSIFNELLETDTYNLLKKDIYFTGWTSLMFKYGKKFRRFSKDLDFSVDIWISQENILTRSLFEDFKVKIQDMMTDNWVHIFETEWDWQTIFFLWKNGDRREFKIDFMYDSILWKETIIIDWIEVLKVSDLDIVCNKLQRLTDIDIFDLDFLYRRNFSRKTEYIDEIYIWLKEKSSQKYGSPISIFTKNKVFWEKQTHNLPYLSQIMKKFKEEFN